MADMSDNSDSNNMDFESAQRPSQTESQTQIDSLRESESSDNLTGSDVSYNPDNPVQNEQNVGISLSSDDGRSV